jgi:hypothetical protein
MRLPRLLSVQVILLPLTVLGYQDPTVVCLNNLRTMDITKTQLEAEQRLKPGNPVRPEVLAPYFSGERIPRCPDGGHYTIGPIGVYPLCSHPGHSEAAFLRSAARQALYERVKFWSLVAGGLGAAVWIGWFWFSAKRRPDNG